MNFNKNTISAPGLVAGAAKTFLNSITRYLCRAGVLVDGAGNRTQTEPAEKPVVATAAEGCGKSGGEFFATFAARGARVADVKRGNTNAVRTVLRVSFGTLALAISPFVLLFGASAQTPTEKLTCGTPVTGILTNSNVSPGPDVYVDYNSWEVGDQVNFCFSRAPDSDSFLAKVSQETGDEDNWNYSDCSNGDDFDVPPGRCTATARELGSQNVTWKLTNQKDGEGDLCYQVSCGPIVSCECAPSGASLEVTKEVTSAKGLGPYIENDIVTYDIVVTNTGNVPLTNVTVTDDDATLGSCAPVQGSGLSNNGDTMTCTASHTISASDVSTGSFANTATGDSNETAAVDSDEVTVTTMAAGPSEVDSDSINCSTGPDDTGVRTFLSNPPQGDWVTLNADGAQIGSEIIFTIVSNSGLTADPSVISGFTGDFDPNQLNNAKQTTTFTVDSGTSGELRITRVSSGNNNVWTSWRAQCVAPPNPELTVTKSVNTTVSGPGPYAVGDTLTYDIGVENTGSLDLTGIVVTDANADVEAACMAPGFALASTASTTCSATHTLVAGDVGTYSNVAIATADDGTTDDSPPVDTPVGTKGLTVTKSVTSGAGPYAIGDTIEYQITVLNSGTLNLTGIDVTDANAVLAAPCDAPFDLIGGGQQVCDASHTVTSGDVEAGSTYTNTASASDGNGTSGSSDPVVVDIEEASSASLSLTKAADQPTFDENDSSVSYTYEVVNTGSVVLTNVNVQDDKIANVVCPTTTLAANGGSVICTGTYQVMPVDILTGGVTNEATAYGTDPSQNEVPSNTETVTVGYVGTTVEEAVDDATSSFILRRMDRLMADGPDRARLLRKRADRAFCGNGGSGADLGQVNIEADDDGMNASGNIGCSVMNGSGSGGGSGSGYGGAASPFDMWIEGNFTAYDSDTGDGSFGVAYVGADWLVNENFLVGFLAQFDWMSEDDGSESDVDGFGWMVGPYLSAEVVDNVFFDARFAWGQSDNDVTVTLSDNPFSGDFDTDRWLASLGVSGNYTNGTWRFTPGVAVTYMEEKRKTFSVSGDGGATNTTINSETFSLGRMTLGPEFAYRFVSGAITFEPQVSAQLIWDFHAQGDTDISGTSVYDAGVRGAVEVGAAFRHENGVSARISGKYDGIGTGGGLEAFALSGWLNLPF